jgi:hypothetical protein
VEGLEGHFAVGVGGQSEVVAGMSLKNLTNGQRQGSGVSVCAPKEMWPPADDNNTRSTVLVVAVSYCPVRKAHPRQTVDRLWVSAYPLHLRSLKGG